MDRGNTIVTGARNHMHREAANALAQLSSDIDHDRDKMVHFFKQLLKINSVNPRMGGPGEQERANFLQAFLDSEGLHPQRVEVPDPEFKSRPNIYAQLEGSDQSKTLWFLSHMDTVPEGSRELWNTDPFDPVEREGKIFARGAEDNGQSLVASIFALRQLARSHQELPFNVGIWGVADEEYGSEYGVKYLLEHDYLKPKDLLVVPDAGTPEGLVIEVAEKHLLWFKITVKGKQVHASLPSKGKNAHRVGMELALRLDKLFHEKYTKSDPMYDDPLSTFEPTKVEPNVANINTVPGLDVFYYDCRVLPEYTLDTVLSLLKKEIQDTEAKNKVEISLQLVNREDAGPATPPTSEVAQLMQKAIREVVGKQPKFMGIGGQTVANLFRKKGYQTAVWSTVDDLPHEPNEYSKISNLLGDAKVFAAMPLLA